jgi:hypothetical protein
MHQFPHVKFPLWLALICLVSSCGCGTNTYEQRLGETRKLFAEINEMEKNLGREENVKGVQIRMPSQFDLIPAPKVETDEEGNIISMDPDLRQPHFSNEPLPGLIGGWKAMVSADVAGEQKEVPAYIYLLSNHYLWAAGDPGAATAFHTTVLESVVSGMGLPEPQQTDWEVRKFPAATGMIQQKSSTVWTTKTSRPVDETLDELELHLFENGNMKVSLIVVYPDTIDPSEKLPQRMELALQTIRIDKQEPGIGKDGESKPSTSGF